MRALLVLATLGAVSLAPDVDAATVTVGAKSLATQSSVVGCSMGCHFTTVQSALQDPGIVASPGDGSIVGWRVVGDRGDSSDSYICPAIVHPPAGGQYTSGAHLSATSAACGFNVATQTDGTLNSIAAPLAVQAGDLIGVDIVSNSSFVDVYAKPAPLGAARLEFDPVLTDTPRAPLSTNADELMVNFEVQLAAPAITTLSPASGDGGTQVTIAGQHLANATGVMFGGVAGTITSNTNDQIVVVAPPGNQGSVDVTVTTMGGSASSPFTYPSPPPPTVDTTPPVLSSLALSPKRFRAANIGSSIAVAVGGRVRYSVSEASAVTFTVQRLVSGHRRGGRCRAGGSSGKRCTIAKSVKGSFTRAARAGQDQFRFTARLGGKTLKPGRYRLTAKAKDATGNASTASTATFTVVR